MRRPVVFSTMLLAAACRRPAANSAVPAAGTDTSFAAMQQRGAAVMGVDQYTSQHVFEDMPDGGRIVLDRQDTTDTAGVGAIRNHMRQIATDFEAGDFSKPFAIHGDSVPGTTVMAQRRELIRYVVKDRPAGGEVGLHSTDTVAINAIHRFLAFQRTAHHAGGHEMMMDSMMHHDMP